LQFFIC
jgi:hypothetical protein